MKAADRLEDRFGFTFYRIPAEATEEFLAAARRAADVYGRYALSWSLWRDRQNPEDWVEIGPDFRERAALDRAAAALEAEGILERLASFEVNLRAGEPVFGILVSNEDHDLVFKVGGA